MLIYLTNSLIVDPQDKHYNSIRIAIRNIALAVIESKHLLRGDYEVLCSMCDIFKSDVDIFPLFRKLSIEYATHTIPNSIRNYVEVVKENPIRRYTDSFCIDQVAYEYFMDTLKVQPMNFILEDDDDNIIYELIVNWYIKEKQLNTNTSYSIVHGGGNNILDVVNKHIKQGYMAVCITDPDLHFPEQTIKNDSCCAKCARMNAKGGIYYHYYPKVHEMENLIPLNYIDCMDWHLKQNALDKAAFEKLSNCEKREEILKFFDYREGIKKEQIENTAQRDNFYEYAKLCCEQNLELLAGLTFEEYYDQLQGKDYVYPRLKKRIIPEIKQLLEHPMPDPSLMNFQKEEWLKIGEFLVGLFCARNKETLL